MCERVTSAVSVRRASAAATRLAQYCPAFEKLLPLLGLLKADKVDVLGTMVEPVETEADGRQESQRSREGEIEPEIHGAEHLESDAPVGEEAAV